jgi:hypothetical protein
MNHEGHKEHEGRAARFARNSTSCSLCFKPPRTPRLRVPILFGRITRSSPVVSRRDCVRKMAANLSLRLCRTALRLRGDDTFSFETLQLRDSKTQPMSANPGKITEIGMRSN